MNNDITAILSQKNLRTKVGFCGTVTRQEVAGPACLGVIIGIISGDA